MLSGNESHWKQYKKNPHIQKNQVTNEFQCKTCKIPLGNNAGGVGGHCKSTHKMKIDGTLIIKKPPEPFKTISSSDPKKTYDINGMPRESSQALYDKILKETHHTENKQLHTSNQIPPELQKFRENCLLYREYDQAERAGYPEVLLKPLIERLGIEKYHEQRQFEKMGLKMKKEKEERRRQDLKEINDSFRFSIMATNNPEVQKILIFKYIQKITRYE
jgi:hypothetical protein